MYAMHGKVRSHKGSHGKGSSIDVYYDDPLPIPQGRLFISTRSQTFLGISQNFDPELAIVAVHICMEPPCI